MEITLPVGKATETRLHLLPSHPSRNDKYLTSKSGKIKKGVVVHCEDVKRLLYALGGRRLYYWWSDLQVRKATESL